MAAEKKTQKQKVKKQQQSRPKLTEQQRKVIVKVSGLVIGAFAIFTFIAIVSYFFTWKADYSLLSDKSMMDQGVEVSNLAGKLGYKWAYFLVSRCFGLASLALVFLLGAVALRLFLDRKGLGFVRTLLVTVSGAFVFSLLLAYLSDVSGAVRIFGTGLGGDCGMALNLFLVNLTGRIVTFIVILILIVVWLLLASGRFSLWLSKIGEHNGEDGKSDAGGKSDADGKDADGRDSGLDSAVSGDSTTANSVFEDGVSGDGGDFNGGGYGNGGNGNDNFGDVNGSSNGYGNGYGNGNVNGSGNGYGNGYDNSDNYYGNDVNDGNDNGYSDDNGNGYDNGNDYSNVNGNGNGSVNGNVNGNGNGSVNGNVNGGDDGGGRDVIGDRVDNQGIVGQNGGPVILPENDFTHSDGDHVQGGQQTENTLEVVSGDGFSTEVKKDLPRIDNREELENYKFPPLDLLQDYASGRHEVASEELERNNNKIRATLLSYKIQVERVTACVGPTVTLYKVVPAPGVKIAAIKNLDQDIAMSLNTKGVRVVRLPDSVGIEVANDRPSIVPLKSMLNDDAFRNSKAELPIAIGYTITQKVKVFDLADAPHLLVAGATKQGKSVGLNVIITSLLYSKHPSELKFVFIDPKMVEFTSYARLLKHYLAVLPNAADEKEEMENAIIKTQKQAEEVLKSLCIEMDERYLLLSKAEVNNIKLYNEKYKDRYLLPTEGHRFLPYLVVVIDEYADLIMSGGLGGDSKKMSGSITTSIIRLAQKGRAAGIHVIIATQRPSVDVITGLIKTNFPTRIAFRVSQRQDSSTILGSTGAERLIGKGDMLYYAGIDMERVQCALVDISEITAVTTFISSQTGYKKSYNTPYYLPPVNNADDGQGGGMIDMQNIDSMFEEAAKLVVQFQQGSTSSLQRKLGLGYARAGKVMDQLEAAGIVGPQEGSKPRQVLVPDMAELEPILRSFLG